MLIICPNCLATYRLKETILLENNSWVECKQCNQIWFQYRQTDNVSIPARTFPTEKKNWIDATQDIKEKNETISPELTSLINEELSLKYSEETNTERNNSSAQRSDEIGRLILETASKKNLPRAQRSYASFFGFATVSIIIGVLHLCYLHNDTVIKLFPQLKETLEFFNNYVSSSSEELRQLIIELKNL